MDNCSTNKRIVVLGSSYSIDNEICIVKHLQDQGWSVRYYIHNFSLSTPLFRLKNEYRHDIINVREVDEFKKYAYYLNLDNIYIVNTAGLRFRDLRQVWIMIKLAIQIILYNPNCVHYTWPQTRTAILSYLNFSKKIFTVHDPIPHSSHKDDVIEKYRKIAFKLADKLILLNTRMTKEFCQRYNIRESKIAYSKLGYFDYLDDYKTTESKTESPYVLFFGQIASYKGIEYLCASMVQIHDKFPEWKLVIAGGGKLYFDYSEFEKYDFIEMKNYFIEMDELVPLIKNCEFAVAPYKDATQSGLLLNSMSLNKPMIVTNVGALPDMVTDGVTGLIIPPCDVNALSFAMSKMMSDNQLRSYMSDNISKLWRPRFEWSEIIRNLTPLYI